ncbi:MAG: c-type cytochrome [Gammaproteobacteria bacterium]|nr:c-type cytochrome [Gammaproteobacteria bacterium]
MKNIFSNKPLHSIGSSLLLVLLGVILWGAFNTGMEATNTLTFCISCHEMENTVYQEYRHSAHASNPSGVRAACSDCHVPKQWIPKLIRKIEASVEVYHWLVGSIDTKEKFEAKRAHLANKVWDAMQKTDSRECRNCHDFNIMNLAGQARFAARIHADAIDQKKTCIDCHKGIAHQLPKTETLVKTEDKDVDIELGEEINETCAGCHGENGEGSIDGEYPRLAGMSINYLSRQLNNFKDRKRLNIPMLPYTTERELPAEDINAVVHYLQKIKLLTKLRPLEEGEAESGNFDALSRLEAGRRMINIARYPGDIAAGKRSYTKECATCHGKNAEGGSDGFIPPLAGQHSRYIKHQIENFRKAERLHDDPKDAEVFKQFGDSEIDDILAYLSVLDD